MIRSLLTAILTILSSGLLYYYSENYHSAWYLMWIAPVPVLLYILHHRFWPSVIVVFCAGFFRALNFLIGEQTIGPHGSFIIESLINTAEWTIVVLGVRYFARRERIALFLYPCALTILEWLQSIGPGGTFATIAYSQLRALPVVQIASLTGFYGVSFILSLFSATLAYCLASYKEIRTQFWIPSLGFAVVLASVIFGLARLQLYDTNALPSISSGLASIQADTERIFDPSEANSLADEYVPLIENLASQGARVVLLPEEVASFQQGSKPAVQSKWGDIARNAQVFLIVGFREYAGPAVYNIAWVFSPDGELLGEYTKKHLVPSFEARLSPGNQLVRFTIEGQKAAVAICRDLDYPNPARAYGKERVGLLFVPAWDFFVDAYFHAQGAFMRGIENGYSLVRSARAGLLTVTSPTGQMLGETPALGTPPSILLANAPVALETSFYAKCPWLFIAVVGALFVLGIVAFFRARRHKT